MIYNKELLEIRQVHQIFILCGTMNDIINLSLKAGWILIPVFVGGHLALKQLKFSKSLDLVESVQEKYSGESMG